MNYPDGQNVKIGDLVKLGDGSKGVVVCSIDNSEYSEDHSELQWGYLKKGVMIDFHTYGLIHFETADSDLELVARKSDSS